jgi:hypothetical protein
MVCRRTAANTSTCPRRRSRWNRILDFVWIWIWRDERYTKILHSGDVLAILTIIEDSQAHSQRRLTARQIQSKSTEFVCPSSTCPLSLARNDARRPDRFSQKVQNSSVRRQPFLCPLTRNDARRPDRFSQKVQNSSVHRLPPQKYIRRPPTATADRRP